MGRNVRHDDFEDETPATLPSGKILAWLAKAGQLAEDAIERMEREGASDEAIALVRQIDRVTREVLR
jgi:hypothetical protein